MGWTTGVRFPAEAGIPLYAEAPRPALEPTQPPIRGTGVQRLGREADHPPLHSAEVKNAWGYTSTPPEVFMTWYLVKHMDNFTFYNIRKFRGYFDLITYDI
jgi:hypothetical protein